MVLGVGVTLERADTLASVVAGNYSNIRMWDGGTGAQPQAGNWIHPAGPNASCSVETNENSAFWCTAQQLAQTNAANPTPRLYALSAMCFLSMARVSDLMVADGKEPPVFGLMHVAVGGTLLEQWAPIEIQTLAGGCVNNTCLCSASGCNASQPITEANCSGSSGANAGLWRGQLEPLVNFTIGMLLFYQGENNGGSDAGSALYGTGYACLFAKFIASVRAAFSFAGGTSDPLLPVGVVTLADGTDEGEDSRTIARDGMLARARADTSAPTLTPLHRNPAPARPTPPARTPSPQPRQAGR